MYDIFSWLILGGGGGKGEKRGFGGRGRAGSFLVGYMDLYIKSV